LNLAKLGQNLGWFGANFFGFEARFLRAQIGKILICSMGCLGFFLKAELEQIWGLFWNKGSVHWEVFKVVGSRGQIWGLVGSSLGNVCRLNSKVPR